jgi:mannose/fructose/N-acetylgalactosamine-specific phosphotransferase system component IIC
MPAVEATADEFGVALFGAAGVGVAAHAIYTGVKKRKNNKDKDKDKDKEKEKDKDDKLNSGDNK